MYISSVKIKIILAKQQMSLRQFCKINNLAYSTVEKIAQALGVKIYEILEEK